MKIVGYSREEYGHCDLCGSYIKHEFHMDNGQIFGVCCAGRATGWRNANIDDLRRYVREQRQEEARQKREKEYREANKKYGII